VKLRKRTWQRREAPLEPEGWGLFSSAGLEPDAEAEQSELLETLQSATAQVLTPHQRMCSCPEPGPDRCPGRAAEHQPPRPLYKTLPDARPTLRKHLQERELALDNEEKR
jgi:hypothetical protein